MLTKAQIKKNLEEDPNWEPNLDATDEEWDLYDEVRDEMYSDSDSYDEE